MRALVVTLVASAALLSDPVPALGAEVDIPSPPRSGDPWIDEYADYAVDEVEYVHWLIHWAVGDPDPADVADVAASYAESLARSGQAWLHWRPTLRNCIEALTPDGSDSWGVPRVPAGSVRLHEIAEGWVLPPADWCPRMD